MIISLYATIGMQNILLNAFEELAEEMLASIQQYDSLVRGEAAAVAEAVVEWQRRTGQPGAIPDRGFLVADLMERIRALEMEAETLRT